MRRHEDPDPGEQDSRGSGADVPRSGVRPRWIVAVIVAVLLLIFGVQNAERVDVDFLVVDFQIRVVVMILASAALGFVAGWLVGHPGRRERRAREGKD